LSRGLQLGLPRRFKLRLPYLFLPFGFPASGFQSRGLSPFHFLPSGLSLRLLVLSCPLLSQRFATQTLLPRTLLTFGLYSRRFAPGRLLSARGVLS
jgi:hypothetical protein